MKVKRFAALALLALTACAPSVPATPSQPATSAGSVATAAPTRSDNQAFKVAVSGLPANMTPASGFTNQFVYQTIYDPIVEISKNFELKPAVAEKWDVSADGKVWTFTIRKGMTFSNGDPVTTDDVAFSFNEMIARKWPGLTFINSVTEAKAVDASTVAVTTRTPDMSVPSGTQFVFVLPKKYYEAQGGFDGFQAKPIGSGPYVMTDFIKDSRMVFTLRKEPHAYRKPIATQLTMLAVPENGQKINGLRTGDIDLTAPSAYTSDQIVAAESAGLKFSIQRNAFIFISIIQGTAESRKSPLTNLKVRQALDLAVDKELITKTLYRGYAEPLGQMAFPGTQSWDPSVKPVFNLARAKQLMAESGYANGFAITVDTANSQNLGDLLLLIQANWKEIGVTLNINTVDGTLYTDKVYGRNNQSKNDLVASGNGDTNGFNTAIRVLYGCGKPIGSPAGSEYYCNQAWDTALDQALAERDATKRKALFLEANKILRDDAAVVPLYAPASFAVFTKDVAGVDISGYTQFTLDSMYRTK